jgi:hypothetical protein
MARHRIYTTHNIYMLGCKHITLTECTFVFGARLSIQCLQALPTIINLVIVESVNVVIYERNCRSLKHTSVQVETDKSFIGKTKS